MVRLYATQGSDEANWGTFAYRVDNDGSVDVPEEAVADLIKTGGYVLDAPKSFSSAGLARVRRADGGGLSYGGVSYEPDEDGVITVPAEAVDELQAHGFKPVGESVAEVKARVAVSPRAAPASGLAILQGEAGQGASWQGQSFSADEDGLVLVPEAAIADLAAHGFTVADTTPPAAAPEPVEPVAETIVEPGPVVTAEAVAPAPEPEPVIESTVEPQTEMDEPQVHAEAALETAAAAAPEVQA